MKKRKIMVLLLGMSILFGISGCAKEENVMADGNSQVVQEQDEQEDEAAQDATTGDNQENADEAAQDALTGDEQEHADEAISEENENRSTDIQTDLDTEVQNDMATDDHGTLEEWELQGAGDDAGYFVIECPDWQRPYMADGILDTLTASPVKLTEISKDASDCLFAEDWSAETGIPLPDDLYAEGYSDDAYYYCADNSAEEGRIAVDVSEVGTYNVVGTYDFSNYLDTPTPGNDYTTLWIPYAAIYDGVLYTEIAHRTYSADQPCTGYIVAVEVETGKLLWRSEMLVANGRNFVVGEDTIICGYGFTDEDDYLCILSRHSGAVLEKRKLKTAPDYFIPVDDLLYVLTYDTVYQYQISE